MLLFVPFSAQQCQTTKTGFLFPSPTVMELQNCFSQGRCCFIQTKVALKTPEFFPIIRGNSFIAVESSHRQRFSRSSWALMDWEVISHDDEATTKIIGRSQGKKPYLSQGLKFNFQPILLYKKIEQNELMMTHRFAFRQKRKNRV